MSNQSLALWRLGRSLTALPEFQDPELSIGTPVFSPSIARDIADKAGAIANTVLNDLYGSKPYSPDAILRNVYGPLSGDSAAIARAA